MGTKQLFSLIHEYIYKKKKKKKKMAVTQQSTALAFDGFYGELARLGLPLPLVASLKLNNLTLESAMWNVRCSATGFSVSLFWPSRGAKKKRRPRRRRQTTQAKSSQSIAKPEDSGERDSAHNCSVVLGLCRTIPWPLLMVPLLSQCRLFHPTRHQSVERLITF